LVQSNLLGGLPGTGRLSVVGNLVAYDGKTYPVDPDVAYVIHEWLIDPKQSFEEIRKKASDRDIDRFDRLIKKVPPPLLRIFKPTGKGKRAGLDPNAIN
jgi:hypothetical protein